MAADSFFLRQANCYPVPERLLIEAFRAAVEGPLVGAMPEVVYDAFWLGALLSGVERQAAFEAAFSLVHISIEDVGYVTTLNPAWFVAYNAAVEAGEAPISSPCPCESF